VRERLRSGSLAPQLMELAIDAALEGTAQIGDLHSYPETDEEGPDETGDLLSLMESRELVNVRGPAEYYDTIGYVAGVGSHWWLIQIVDSHGAADGFRAIRLGTVETVEPVEEVSSFLPRLLEARPLAADVPDVGLGNARQVLQATRSPAALIYLVTDDMEPGAFWIGQIADLDDAGVLLEKVSPVGTWAGSEHFRYEAITRIGFGGSYEDALGAAVGAGLGD
jgi:hypothetical protein